MSNEPDLSGFPVLRIDQISAVDTDTLAAAHKEAKELIQSLLSEYELLFQRSGLRKRLPSLLELHEGIYR
jgi:hypothetical protein